MLFGNRWSNSSLPTLVKPDKLLVIAMAALRNWILSFAIVGALNNAQHPSNAWLTLTFATFAVSSSSFTCSPSSYFAFWSVNAGSSCKPNSYFACWSFWSVNAGSSARPFSGPSVHDFAPLSVGRFVYPRVRAFTCDVVWATVFFCSILIPFTSGPSMCLACNGKAPGLSS